MFIEDASVPKVHENPDQGSVFLDTGRELASTKSPSTRTGDP
jgi:hypothetical protein